MQQVAQAWLLYRLTHSPFLLGLLGFCGQIPIFILGLWGGAMADRLPKRSIILWTQILSMIQAATLAFLVMSGRLQVWMLFALSFFLGLVNAFDMPARQSYLVELSSKEDMPNAIALNSSMVNGTRMLGPAIAGFLIASFGEGVCFLINALSYLFVVAGLLMMRGEAAQKISSENEKPIWASICEGLRYAGGNSAIRSLLFLLILLSLFGIPYTILMPVFVKEILHREAASLGILTAAGGAGAMIGTLILAGRKDGFGLERLMLFCAGGFGGSLILFSFSTDFTLCLALAPFIGFGMMVSFAVSNTLLQSLVSDEMRGRLMSLFTMTFMGAAPFGSLLLGNLGQRLGVSAAIFLGGCICLLAALLFKGRLAEIRKRLGPLKQPQPLLAE